MTSVPLLRDGDQLEFDFDEMPWNGVSPRYLTREYSSCKMGKPRGNRRVFPEVVTDPHQLEFRLEGGSFGS